MEQIHTNISTWINLTNMNCTKRCNPGGSVPHFFCIPQYNYVMMTAVTAIEIVFNTTTLSFLVFAFTFAGILVCD